MLDVKEESFFPSIWNVFHDGCIDRIEGAVPGMVSVHIDIQYLRKRFSDPGECFVVELPDCKQLSFQRYDEEVAIDNFATIVEECPGILSAEMDGKVCKVFTDGGLLKVSSSDGSIRLDSGREVSLEQLLQAAAEYWDEWEAKSREKN